MSKVPTKIYAKIKSRAKSGWVCSPSDFLDIGSRDAVDQALSRMAKAGVIRRIARGLYDLPNFNVMLNGYSPTSLDQIILAIARRDRIRIINDNIVHANGLGLTSAVPAKLVYLTDGPSKTITAGGWSLRIKHVSPAFMRNATSMSGPLFQALVWIGKNGAKADILSSLIKTKVSGDVMSDMRKRVNQLPQWMKPVIDDVTKNDKMYV